METHPHQIAEINYWGTSRITMFLGLSSKVFKKRFE